MLKKQDYDNAIKLQMDMCSNTLYEKKEEYATEDCFHNFNVAAEIMGITPKQALAGMMVKHTVSIYDMIMSNEEYPIEKWAEKITDNINYLLILGAMVRNELYEKCKNLTESDISDENW